MKMIISFLLIGISFGANAQGNKSGKLHKLYSKGKLEKSESLAKKMLSKEPENIDALYILTLVQLKEAKELNTDAAKKRKLIESIETMNRFPDEENSYFLQVNDSIHFYIRSLVEEGQLKKNYSNAYLKLLAEEFNDTLDEYHSQNLINSRDKRKNYVKGSQDSLRDVLLAYAELLEGTPYKWAGDDPNMGFDCSGFTMYVYKSIGIELPHNAQKQSELINYHKNIEDAVPGDLIFFGSQNDTKFSTQHAGIVYSKNGDEIEVIHCVSNGVNIDGKNSSWEYYWRDKILFVVDVLSYEESVKETGSN